MNKNVIKILTVCLIPFICACGKKSNSTGSNDLYSQDYAAEEQEDAADAISPTSYNNFEFEFCFGEESSSYGSTWQTIHCYLYPKWNNKYLKFDDNEYYFNIAPTLYLCHRLLFHVASTPRDEEIPKLETFQSEVAPYLGDIPTSLDRIPNAEWRERAKKEYYDNVRNTDFYIEERLYGKQKYGPIWVYRCDTEDKKGVVGGYVESRVYYD